MLTILNAHEGDCHTSDCDYVRDGLNDTMPEYGGESNREESVTDAWDFVQENISI